MRASLKNNAGLRLDQRASLLFAAFVLSITAVRLWLASTLELAPDEAYYWQWSHRLAMSYQDHPPFIAWLIRFGTWVAGDTALGVRLPCIVLSLLGIFLVYILSRTIGFEPSASLLTASLSTLLPLPAVGAIIATPDTPLGLFWLLSILGLTRLAVKTEHNPTAWYLVGIGTGMGILTKHSALLIPLVALLAAIKFRAIRRDFRSPHPWLAAALALVLSLPHIAAEARLGFPAITFQMAHLAGTGTENSPLLVLERLGGLLGGQLGLVTPLVLVWSVLWLASSPSPVRFILAWGWLVPLFATGVSSVFAHPEQNWASMGHPLLALMTIGGIVDKGSRSNALPRVSRNWIVWVFATVIVFTSVVYLHGLRPFLPLPPKKDPVSRLHGWAPLATLAPMAANVDGILCDNYGLAAQTAWSLRRLATSVAVASTDRSQVTPTGRLLLLEEQGEWGDAKLRVRCAQKDHLLDIHMRIQNRGVVRSISVSVGEGCKAHPTGDGFSQNFQ